MTEITIAALALAGLAAYLAVLVVGWALERRSNRREEAK